MTHVHYDYLYPRHSIDASHDRFSVDHNRCVLCQRCVRVCDEIEGAHTWDVMGRGITSRVITDLNQPWGSSETCTGCGKCVQVCPTGALSEKGKSVAEMTKAQTVPALPANDAEGRDQMSDDKINKEWLEEKPHLARNEEPAAVQEEGSHRHHLARRLFRLPHVFSRP